MMMFIAEDWHQFKELFTGRLRAMLSNDELGAFILVLANCLQDEALKQSLMPDLLRYFRALKSRHQRAELQATQDDLDVLHKLSDMDIASLPVWQEQRLGAWRMVINVMRQLRPARASAEKLSSIYQPFDDSRFHFNKPFLKPEILWQGQHEDRNIRVLYNKFPFVKYHLLIVISPELNRPQMMDQDTHQFVFALAQQYNERVPGFGIGYNSIAAGASVNHQHFQGFVDVTPLAIENPENSLWQETSRRFTDTAKAWQFMEQCLQQDIAFNCLYRAGCCYIMPRAYQGEVEVPHWLSGAGWSDLSGLVTVPSQQILNTIDLAQLDAAASRLNRAVN